MPSLVYQTVYEETLSLLTNDNEGNKKRILQEIISWEDANPRRDKFDGFEWHNVHGDARTLNSFVTRHLLDIVFKTNKSCIYKTSNKRAIKKAISDFQGSLIKEIEEVKEIPKNLFDIVVGHESKKELLRRSVKSETPIHAILFGSIASAKTLMLEELARLPDNCFVMGSSLTRAGLTDLLFSKRPTYLILDELDKIDSPQNLAVLLGLMEKGWVSETKYKRHQKIRLKCWVFASANDIRKIPPELLSRFLLLKFKDYDDAEFGDVVVNILHDREKISKTLAIYISQKVLLDLKSKDVRNAIRVCRLLRKKSKSEVDFLIEIMKKQK